MTRPDAQTQALQKVLPETGQGDITDTLPEQIPVHTPSLCSSPSISSPLKTITGSPAEQSGSESSGQLPSQPPFVWTTDGRAEPRSCPCLTPFQRLACTMCGLLLLAGFLFATQLQPSARGYGTHQQLGLPPCSIQLIFGIPCPSCGMTTSFALFVRGQIPAAFQANPAGLYLAIVCSGLMPWLFVTAWQNRPWNMRRLERWALGLTGGFVGLALLHWAVRLWLGF